MVIAVDLAGGAFFGKSGRRCVDKDGQFVRVKCREFYVNRVGGGDANGNDKTARKLKFRSYQSLQEHLVGDDKTAYLASKKDSCSKNWRGGIRF